jgi:hypothetical protein
MPFEIVVETMVQEKIMEALKESYLPSKQTRLLEAIALALQENMKIQRDILSILEAWQEEQSSNHKEEKSTEGQ